MPPSSSLPRSLEPATTDAIFPVLASEPRAGSAEPRSIAASGPATVDPPLLVPSRDAAAQLRDGLPGGSSPGEDRPVGSGATEAARLAEWEEERAKDRHTFRRAAHRRFWSTIAISVLLIGATQAGLAGLPAEQMLALFVAAIGGNWALTWLATHPRHYRGWMRHCFAAFDSALLSVVVLAFGAPVLAVSYLLAIVPYSFDRGRALGYTSALTSVAGFLLACWGHEALGVGDPVRWSDALLAAALVLLVSLQVIPLGSRFIRRVRATRAQMARVAAGDLTAQADGRHDDELGFLARGYNAMLDRLAASVERQRREAVEVAAVASQLTHAAAELSARAQAASEAARQLHIRLGDQQAVARQAGSAVRVARDDAQDAAARAMALAADVHAMESAAAEADEAVRRAAETLTRIAEGVRRAAARVEALDPSSRRVADAVATISRLARRTNLLALNAGIEATRAGEHGVGFAVVADEIRGLAEESGRAAQSIAETVDAVRLEIDGAVGEMRGAARLVEDTEQVARAATGALVAVRSRGAVVNEAAEVLSGMASGQARAITAVTAAIEEVDALAAEAVVHAGTAADAAAAQAAAGAQVGGSATLLGAAAARLHAAG